MEDNQVEPNEILRRDAEIKVGWTSGPLHVLVIMLSPTDVASGRGSFSQNDRGEPSLAQLERCFSLWELPEALTRISSSFTCRSPPRSLWSCPVSPALERSRERPQRSRGLPLWQGWVPQLPASTDASKGGGWVFFNPGPESARERESWVA